MQLFLPFFILLLGITITACSPPATENTANDNNDNVSQTVEKEEEKSDITIDDSQLKKVTLPGGSEIAFTKGGYCDQIVKELNADSPNFGKAFALESIVMDKGHLNKADARELSSLVQLLALAPHLSILLEGNDKVLLEAIQKQLEAEGMKKARIDIRVSREVGTPQIRLKET